MTPVRYDPKHRGMIELIRNGSTIRAAAGAVGISERTWHRWRAAAQAGECTDADVAALVTDAMEAYDAATADLHAKVVAAAAEDWKAAAWALEHRRGDPKVIHDTKRARYEADVAKARAEGTHVDRVSIDAPKTREDLLAEARGILAELETSEPTKH